MVRIGRRRDREARDDGRASDDTGTGRRGRQNRRGKRRAPWWELPVLVVAAVAVAVLVKTFVAQPFYIPSESMEHTLHGCTGCNGDRILTFKPVYSADRDPHPGDIVVFRDPGGWLTDPPPAAPSNPVLRAAYRAGQFVGLVPPNENDLVKRVIAIGGQTVKCCDADGNVQVGDHGPTGAFRSLDDASYTYETVPGNGRQPFGPVTVPNGRLWVMGDHRDASADSRYHCGPSLAVVSCSDAAAATSSTVPISLVRGKAVVIAWPVSRWTTLGTPTTFASIPLLSSAPASPPSPPTSPPWRDGGTAALLLPLGVGVVATRRRRTRRLR